MRQIALLLLFLIGVFAAWANARRLHLGLSLARPRFVSLGVTEASQSVLEIHYDLGCLGDSSLGWASFELGARWFRIALPEGGSPVRIVIPGDRQIMRRDLLIESQSGCRLSLGQVRQKSGTVDQSSRDAELVLRHSPMIVERPDQQTHPETDAPLLLGWEWLPSEKPGSRILRYTVVFSDEDSLRTLQDEAAQLSIYGRRTDIEWVYEVELDSAGSVIGRWFQADLGFGVGHDRREFAGQFFDKTEHPLIYNFADHNVFSDRPSLGWSGGRIWSGAPVAEIDPAFPREQLLFAYPWLFWVSDRELARENKLGVRSDELIYRWSGDRLIALETASSTELKGPSQGYRLRRLQRGFEVVEFKTPGHLDSGGRGPAGPL